MREPIFSSVKRPRISPEGAYLCDLCGNGVTMIAFDGQRFVCHECQTANESGKQPEAEADSK